MSMKDQRSIIPWQKISVADSDPLPLPEHIDEKELESLERSDRRPARWTSVNEMENLNGRLTSIGRRSMIGWFVTLQIFSTIENLQRQEKKNICFNRVKCLNVHEQVDYLVSNAHGWTHQIKTLMIRQKNCFNLLELYDQQANWSMSADVGNNENKVRLHVDDEHRESNDDVSPLLHEPNHTDHKANYWMNYCSYWHVDDEYLPLFRTLLMRNYSPHHS